MDILASKTCSSQFIAATGQLPRERHCHTSVIYGDSMFAFGGIDVLFCLCLGYDSRFGYFDDFFVFRCGMFFVVFLSVWVYWFLGVFCG